MDSSAVPPTGPAKRPLRILVVDDDELDRLTVRRCLLQSGMAATIDEAASAAEAIDRVRPDSYDCVLLDYYMPGGDTLSLLRRFHAAAADVPVIIFTGRGDEEVAVELMKAGAVDYLPKASLTPERLATSCRYALEMSRAAAARRNAEEELRAQEARFRSLANAIPQLAWMTDGEGEVYWFNQRWYDYTGTTFEEPHASGWDRVHPDHLHHVAERFRRSFKTGESWEDTFPLRAADGQYRWFLSRALPMRGEDGTITGWFGTNTDITEQKHGEFERERLLALEQTARTDAERATRARDEVLAIVAHDLRNPMHTIMAAASMLALAADDDKRLRHVGIIQRSIQEMERLISDLLDVARIESGTLPIRHEPVELQALVDEALELFESQAVARKIPLHCHIEQDVQPIRADRDRLIQVLSNLVGNALKFTSGGDGVSVRASRLAGGVQISVKDSGTGIPPADLPHVFDRFWQASRESRAGAGLGLAICKGIVEAHGGRIWAESAVGRGTTVHFTVPHQEA